MTIYTDSHKKQLDELGINSFGVIQREGGFDAARSSRVLVIGLGGMGLKTLRRLKKEMMDRVGKIDGNYLQLLSVDTDKRDREQAINESILSESEIPHLDNSNLSGTLAAPASQRPECINEILPEGFAQSLTGQGANQVRLAGRLTFFELNLFNSIWNVIEEAIQKLNNFAQSTLDVHIVAGIGGGSGSGMVVDMPYLVRAIVHNLGLPSSRLRMFGHVYLPNSYTGIANKDSAIRNGYAALKEIDYYMNIESIGESYDVLYPNNNRCNNGRFSSKENIFKMCTLIGGKIAAPILIKDPQKKAIAVCVDDLINQCTTKVNGNLASGGTGNISDFFDDQSFQVNSANALDVVMANPNLNFPGNGNYCYNMIGSTSVVFPSDKIINHMLGELSSKADDVLKANAASLTQKDIDDFENRIAKPYEIINALVDAASLRIDGVLNDGQIVWNIGTLMDRTLTDLLEIIINEAVNSFDKNNDFMTKARGAINTKATEIFKNPKKGPYYLRELLTCRTGNGGKVGYFEKMANYYSAVMKLAGVAAEEERQFTAQMKERAERMQHFGHFHRNLPAYKEDLKKVYLEKLKKKLCDKLMQEYYDSGDASGQKKINSLKYTLEQNFLTAVDVVEMINAKMIENGTIAKNDLENPNPDDPTSIFNITDSVFEDLKATIRGTVAKKLENLGPDAALNYIAALTAEMMEHRDAWKLSDTQILAGTSECAAAFRDFIKNYPPLGDIVNRSMLDYFEAAYGYKTEAEKARVVDALVNHIKYYSAPMCNVWQPPFFDFSLVEPLCYSYLVLPDALRNGFNGDWGRRFQDAFKMNVTTKNIFWSPDQDAAYGYTLYSKMPIWIHQDLVEYEKKYADLNMPGIHVNENAVSQKPSYKDYPSLMLQSQWYRADLGGSHYNFQPEQDMMEKVTKTVRFAIRHGIMVKDVNGRFVVRTITDKPNPSDERSSPRIRKVLDDFVSNPANFDENYNPVSEKQLYENICEKFGSENNMIYNGRGGFVPDTEERAVLLIRKQMKLWQKLIDEVDYYKKNFGDELKKVLDDWKKILRTREFAQYILYSFVYEQNRNWYYELGERNELIVLAVQAPAELRRDYMEFAAFDAMYKMEDINRVTGFFKKLIAERQVMMAKRDQNPQGQVFYDDFAKKADVLTEKCTAVIKMFEDKKMYGKTLTAAEDGYKKFYKLMLEEVEGQKYSF